MEENTLPSVKQLPVDVWKTTAANDPNRARVDVCSVLGILLRLTGLSTIKDLVVEMGQDWG